jgi:hypothetical protein
MKPIRFGARAYERIHPKNWIKTVQHIEKLGYSTIFEDDHFDTTNEELPTPSNPSENRSSITPDIRRTIRVWHRSRMG